MNVAARLGTYAGVLVVVLGAGFGIGRLVDDTTALTTPAAVVTPEAPFPTPSPLATPLGTPAPLTPSVAAPDELFVGLTASRAGYTFAPASTDLTTGDAVAFSFSIIDPDGRVLTDYTGTDEGDLRLLVVHRDLLGGLQWIRPDRDDAGRWSATLALPAAGVYRVVVDFTPARSSTAITLGNEVTVTEQALSQSASTHPDEHPGVPSPAPTPTLSGSPDLMPEPSPSQIASPSS